ncbi:hypothetical protein SY94_3276 [Agrobacterium tumefaciens]|nr:hypothetical protein SY94_3276 [Agrobacterium tumefaciens]
MDAIAGINLQVPRIASSKIDPDCLAIAGMAKRLSP